jgi:molybdopterin/thiamine biosynthesis adenylyltransferase
MFAYKPDFLPSSIILIGAGGTGSRLMPMMSQLVRTCLKEHNPNAWLQKLPIYVIDGDEVEEKNLLRQNFIRKDVGRPKAAVVAQRYAAAFDIAIHPICQFVTPDTSWLPEAGDGSDMSGWTFNNSIVILAVDSAIARRTILRQIFHNKIFGKNSNPEFKCFIIDAGNEDAFGQVKFFTADIQYDKYGNKKEHEHKRYATRPLTEHHVNYIPMDVSYYENLGSSADEMSCADLPQTLAVNALAATWISCILQNFLYLKPVIFDGVRFSMNGSVSTEFNSAQRWRARTIYNYDRKPIDNFIDTSAVHIVEVGSGGKDIYIASFNENVKLYNKAGMILDSEGNLNPKVQPAPKLNPGEARLKATTETSVPEMSIETVPPLVPSIPAPAVEVPQLRRTRRVTRTVAGPAAIEDTPLPVPAPMLIVDSVEEHVMNGDIEF